jgi:hypothetical protein
MSDSLELISSLQPDTVNNLLAHAKMLVDKPQVTIKYHVCISSPLIGQRNYSFDDLDSLRRELTRSVTKLTLGSIHLYYGYELPVTSDASGQNLFVVDHEGNEVSITNGWNERHPINEGEFGPETEKINLETLI